MIHFLVHDTKDTVAVAVVDIPAGTQCTGRDLSTNRALSAKTRQNIPLGHKFALRDFVTGDVAIKYGCEIGKAVQPIKTGEHVHVHNLKTQRWA